MKKLLRKLLEQRRLAEIAPLAVQKKRVLGSLVSLTFDADPQIGWRAVEAMGVAADAIAEHDPDYVRNHLQRLQWLLSEESGGVCWRAPEAMAEIVRRRPQAFADYVPIIVSLLLSMAEEDLEPFRAGILWAIGRLGPLAAAEIPGVLPAITAALKAPAPGVRGMAVWCLAEVGQARLLANRPELLSDVGPVDLYEAGLLRRTCVRHLAGQALGRQHAAG